MWKVLNILFKMFYNLEVVFRRTCTLVKEYIVICFSIDSRTQVHNFATITRIEVERGGSQQESTPPLPSTKRSQKESNPPLPSIKRSQKDSTPPLYSLKRSQQKTTLLVPSIKRSQHKSTLPPFQKEITAKKHPSPP